MKIYKYNIGTSGKIVLPVGSTILSVSNQRESIVLHALVDPSPDQETMEERHIVVATTGGTEICGGSHQFIGTVLLCGGDIVVHVFENLKP